MRNLGEASGAPRLPWRAAGVALSALLLACAACGGDGGDGDDGGDSDERASGDSGQVEELLGPEDPASGEPVRIGMISDGQTASFDNTDELRAADAAAEYWNTHRGGVDGRPIEVVTCETGVDPAGAADCANQMVEDDVVAVAVSVSGVSESVWDPLHQAAVPTLFLQDNSSDMLTDDTTSFVMANPLATLFGLPIAVAESEGADRIAFVTVDVPPALTAFESGDAERILDNAGLDYDLIRIPLGTADMTSQMAEVANSGADVVHVLGNDAFCIAAYQGLAAMGYEGAITSISYCITDATREAVPGDQLEGISITATMALGADDDPAYQLYEAVMSAYGDDVDDIENPIAMGGYTVMASLATALGGAAGDITTESAAEAIRAMPEADYPGAGGMTFQCGGSAYAAQPAVCTNQSLRAVLDAEGQPATYEPIDAGEILDGL
jgi:branched-chain amino acid transport system substrate-binding protein